MLSAVDLQGATDAGDLAEAMSRTATSANIAGVEMSKLIGYVATVGEVTQKEVLSIGESFKTIFARMRDIKLGKLTDEDGESLSDKVSFHTQLSSKKVKQIIEEVINA